MKPAPRRHKKTPKRRPERRAPSTPPPVDRLVVLIDRAAAENDVEILDASISPLRNIRIILDREEGLGATRLVSFVRGLRTLMFDGSIDPGDYQIEVDTPGEDRLLRTAAHFERFAGADIRVRRGGSDVASSERMTLLGADEGRARVRDRDGEVLLLDPSEVDEIRLVPLPLPSLGKNADSGPKRPKRSVSPPSD